MVTDAPGAIDDFRSLTVSIKQVKIHRADIAGDEDPEGNETSDGWRLVDVDASFDLRKLLDGNVTSLVNQSLPTGRYTQIRLVVTKADGVLTDGSTVEVRTPNRILKIVKSFDVESGKVTTFVADINVVQTGKSGGYQLQPVVGKAIVIGPR